MADKSASGDDIESHQIHNPTESSFISKHEGPKRFRSPPRTLDSSNNGAANNKSQPSLSTSSDEVTAVTVSKTAPNNNTVISLNYLGDEAQLRSKIRPPPMPKSQSTVGETDGKATALLLANPITVVSTQCIPSNGSSPIKSPISPDLPVNNSGPHRVAIQELKSLRPAFSSLVRPGHSSTALSSGEDITTASSSNSDVQSDKSSTVSLTAEERDLLDRLERQNRLLASKGSSFHVPSRRSSSIAAASLNAAIKANNQDMAELQSLIDHQNDRDRSADDAAAEDADWEFWGSLLQDFDLVARKNGKLLVKKVQLGIPGTLRGAVWSSFVRNNPGSFWKRLQHRQQESTDYLPAATETGTFQPPKALRELQLDDAFVELLKISSPYEKMIVRDLARTFPKHEFFKNAEGAGQESLFNVMKAYSLYDPEVGYCQGLSFIAGALLLNMPDEQAFECLVHLMHTYQLRGLFTPKMELLQLRLYQFDRLLQEVLPRLHEHLSEQGIRSTMYASQWFLTIFAYRFPLEFVYRVLDIIFATGIVYGASGSESSMMDVMFERVSEVASGSVGGRIAEIGTEASLIIFRFALALLKKNQDMILVLDFEPLLEFLKHGLFEIYLSSHENLSIDTGVYQASGIKSSLSTSPTRPLSASGRVHVPKQAMDDLVKDATSPQFKSINRKRLSQLRKEYEDELRQTDPEYLAEKSLEERNQRLLNDLKRSEKALSELSRDHCDLAGQMVTLRLELTREREISDALRNQVSDLKSILGQQISSFDVEDLKRVVDHEIDSDNAADPPPSALPQPDKRIPTLNEQVQILTKQNLNLMEELAEWRAKAETFERLPQQSQSSKSLGGGWKLFQ